jgi:hypothetical protein
MFELRVYGRRSSCAVRYRHGGLAAIVPVDQKIILSETPALTGTGDTVVAVDRPEGADVLAFPAPMERTNRLGNGTRGNGRPKGRPKG